MSVSFLFPPEEKVKKKRDTKAVGDLSELQAAVAMTKAGYTVSKPLGDSHRYDFIIDDGTSLFRVQVKTGRLVNGSINVSCCSTHSHRGGPWGRPYRGEIDFLAVHCPQTGDTYLVPESDLVDTRMHLRVAPTINRQDRNIRWASRYKLA